MSFTISFELGGWCGFGMYTWEDRIDFRLGFVWLVYWREC